MATITHDDLQGSVGIYADSYTMLSTAQDVVEAVQIHVDLTMEQYDAFELVKEFLSELIVSDEDE